MLTGVMCRAGSSTLGFGGLLPLPAFGAAVVPVTPALVLAPPLGFLEEISL